MVVCYATWCTFLQASSSMQPLMRNEAVRPVSATSTSVSIYRVCLQITKSGSRTYQRCVHTIIYQMVTLIVTGQTSPVHHRGGSHHDATSVGDVYKIRNNCFFLIMLLIH